LCYRYPICGAWLLAADFREGKGAADLLGEFIGYFAMARNGFNVTGLRVTPEGMLFPLPLQEAAMLSEVLQQTAPLHFRTTKSWMASVGTPRKAS
jgi:hypothetical protein